MRRPSRLAACLRSSFPWCGQLAVDWQRTGPQFPAAENSRSARKSDSARPAPPACAGVMHSSCSTNKSRAMSMALFGSKLAQRCHALINKPAAQPAAQHAAPSPSCRAAAKTGTGADTQREARAQMSSVSSNSASVSPGKPTITSAPRVRSGPAAFNKASTFSA